MSSAKDLGKQAPRSPRNRLGGYVILARMVDKGRAALAGTAGEYHFACPLDQLLLGFKEVKDVDVKNQLAAGATDEQIVSWFETHGTKKTKEEIETWSNGLEAYHPYTDSERKDWFISECTKTGIKPETSSLFDFLDADDVVSFKK